MAGEYETILSGIMEVNIADKFSLPEALRKIDAELDERCSNGSRASAPERTPSKEDPNQQTLERARVMLAICRVAVRWSNHCKAKKAQEDLQSAMMSGNDEEVQKAQKRMLIDNDNANSRASQCLIGSDINLDDFEGKISDLEALEKQVLEQHQAWQYSTELVSIKEAENELNTKISAMATAGEDIPFEVGLHRLADDPSFEGLAGLGAASLKWLKIKLQGVAAAVQRKVLMTALHGEQDISISQAAIDQVDAFYKDRSDNAANMARRHSFVQNHNQLELHANWRMPYEVQKYKRVAEEYIKMALSKQVMDNEEAQNAMRRYKQMLEKLVESGANKATIDQEIEKIINKVGKQWPGGEPPLEFIATISSLLGTGLVQGGGSRSARVNKLIGNADRMIHAAVGIQKAYRAFKVKDILKRRHDRGQELSDRETRIAFGGGGTGLPNHILSNPNEARQSATTAQDLNKRLRHSRARRTDWRQQDAMEENLRKSIETGLPQLLELGPESPVGGQGSLLNMAVLKLQKASTKAAAQRQYDELLARHEELQEKYKQLEEVMHQSKEAAAAAETSRAAKEAELESQKLQCEQLKARHEGRMALSEAQMLQATSSFEDKLQQVQIKIQNESAVIIENTKQKVDQARKDAREATDLLHDMVEENQRMTVTIEQLTEQVKSMLADHQSDIALNKIKHEQLTAEQNRRHESESEMLQNQLTGATQTLLEARSGGADTVATAISEFQLSMHELQERLKQQQRERSQAHQEMQVSMEQEMEDQVRKIEDKYKQKIKEQHELASKKTPWFQGKNVPKNYEYVQPKSETPWISGKTASVAPVSQRVADPSEADKSSHNSDRGLALVSRMSAFGALTQVSGAVDPSEADKSSHDSDRGAAPAAASISPMLNQLKTVIQQNEEALGTARKMRHAGQDESAAETEYPISDGHALLPALQATFVALDKASCDQLDVDVLCEGLVLEGCKVELDQYIDLQYGVDTLSDLHLNQEFCNRDFSFTDFCETLFLCQRLLLGDVPAKSELRWFHFQRSFGSESRQMESRYEYAACVQHPLSPPAWHWSETGPLTGDGVEVVRDNYYSKKTSDF